MRLRSAPAAPVRRVIAGLCAPFLCLSLLLYLPLRAEAQAQKIVRVTKAVNLKLRLKQSLNSGRIRIGDYVEFEVAEDVKVPSEGGGDMDTIIKGGTSAFGKVLDRRHRFTIFKKGAFAVGGLTTTTVEGKTIKLNISRPKLGEDLGKSADRKDKETRCPNKTLIKEERTEQYKLTCVRGRVYAGSLVENLPSAVLAIATATILTRVRDDKTGDVVAITLVDKVVTEPGLSSLINGVDAVMESGEIFDATTEEKLEIKLPGTKTPEDKLRVCRFVDVPSMPEGHIVTDYFSDLAACKNLPGEQKVYTGKVIERHANKSAGTTMNLCEGPVPPGWVLIDRRSDNKACPLEPGESAREPHYSVIFKTP